MMLYSFNVLNESNPFEKLGLEKDGYERRVRIKA
jgi:hypothetical protein